MVGGGGVRCYPELPQLGVPPPPLTPTQLADPSWDFFYAEGGKKELALGLLEEVRSCSIRSAATHSWTK